MSKANKGRIWLYLRVIMYPLIAANVIVQFVKDKKNGLKSYNYITLTIAILFIIITLLTIAELILRAKDI